MSEKSTGTGPGTGMLGGTILDDGGSNISIVFRRAPSTTDTLRRSSEPRILSQADLRYAQEVANESREGLHDRVDKDPVNIDEDFKYNFVGLTTDDATHRLAVHGPNELPEKTIPRWYIFVQQLWQPMPCLIWLAAIVEAGIQNWIDMGILLLIQLANASIGYYEIVKAGDAVAALKASLKPSATVKRDGKWQNINATLVVPGDLVLLACGSAVPADCRINEGTGYRVQPGARQRAEGAGWCRLVQGAARDALVVWD